MSATNAAFSSSGNTLAFLCPDDVEIWDLDGGSLLKKIHHTGIKSVTFIAGDTHLSILGPSFFKNVDLHTYFGQPGERFHDVVFSSSHVQLALSSVNGNVETWGPANWTLVPHFRNKTFGARLVVTCEQETSALLKVVDPAAGNIRRRC